MFLDRIRQFSLDQPEKSAIEVVDHDIGTVATVTYGQLEENILRTMALLRAKGVEAGDRVALQLPKCLPFLYLHLAIMRLAAISLPLNPGYPPRELSYFLADAEARLLFADASAHTAIASLRADLPTMAEPVFLDCGDDNAFGELLAGLSPAAASAIPLPADPDATCLMIYTSGTTGRPKGAELTHGNLTANLDSLHAAWGWQNEDVLLHVLPIFHVHGLVVALQGALHAGATTIMLSRFDPSSVLELLVERPCSVFMAVPTIHRRSGRCT